MAVKFNFIQAMLQINAVSEKTDVHQLWKATQCHAESLASNTLPDAILILQHQNAPIGPDLLVSPSIGILKKIRIIQKLGSIQDLFTSVSLFVCNCNIACVINLASFSEVIPPSDLPLFMAWICSINTEGIVMAFDHQWDTISYLKDHYALSLI